MPKFRITRAMGKALSAVQRLDRVLFPDDDPVVIKGAIWWLVYNEDNHVVGFGGIGYHPNLPGTCYHRRAGIMMVARGNNLQCKLLKVREQWAKRNKYKHIETYTVVDNPASSNNLIKSGYRVILPDLLYAGESVIYWGKKV